MMLVRGADREEMLNPINLLHRFIYLHKNEKTNYNYNFIETLLELLFC